MYSTVTFWRSSPCTLPLADNVPGVKGIGAKGAAELLQQFGTLDNLLENSAKVPPRPPPPMSPFSKPYISLLGTALTL